MKIGKWIAATAATILLFSGGIAFAQGKGHGKGHDKHGEDDQDAQFYKDHDREVLRGWYDDHRDQLPPGLAKKDRLPPELERQLVLTGYAEVMPVNPAAPLLPADKPGVSPHRDVKV